MTIQERLRALTAPCREVDAEIAEALTGGACIWSRPICGYRFADGGAEVPHYTDDLNAAVELVEREMPHSWDVMRLTTYGTYSARIQCDYTGEHKLPAVALLLALIEAKGD